MRRQRQRKQGVGRGAKGWYRLGGKREGPRHGHNSSAWHVESDGEERDEDAEDEGGSDDQIEGAGAAIQDCSQPTGMPPRTIMGIVTSGGFSYAGGCEQGVAFVNASVLQQLVLASASAADATKWVVLLRVPRSTAYHTGFLRLVR
jgi:hypothetical protein